MPLTGNSVRPPIVRVLLVLTAAFGVGGCRSLPLRPKVANHLDQVCQYREDASRLRRLPLPHEIPVTSETQVEFQSVMEKELDQPDNRLFLNETEKLLRHFRVLTNDQPLREVYLELMRDQVAAYYDPVKKRVATVDLALPKSESVPVSAELTDRFVYNHEFCHAVEDANFDLEKLSKRSMRDLDQNLAMTSLAEGSAVLVGADSLCDGMPLNSATPLGGALISLASQINLVDQAKQEFGSCPPFLAGAMLRPYLDGAAYVNTLRRQAGWQAVDACYRKGPPTTTAEIIFPERHAQGSFEPTHFDLHVEACDQTNVSISTNRMGVLGTALWFGAEECVSARDYGFLKGWLGDQVLLMEDANGNTQTVWLSYWERPGFARAFQKQVDQRLQTETFVNTPTAVRRDGKLVVAVWMSGTAATTQTCQRVAQHAMTTVQVTASGPSRVISWWRDTPWPVSLNQSGCGLFGGYLADLHAGKEFYHVTLASGALVRVEGTPDRHYWGTAFGLLRHVQDEASDFTFWQLPLVASWYRQGSGASRRCRWRVLSGLLIDREPDRLRLFLIPVWRPLVNRE